MLIQLNFIRGVLILYWNPCHMIGDGKPFFTRTAIWAEECRGVQDMKILHPFELRNTMITDRKHALDHKSPPEGKAGRSPSNGILNGMQVIMPELSEGGYEMLCGTNMEDLPRLVNDPFWRKYAEPR